MRSLSLTILVLVALTQVSAQPYTQARTESFQEARELLSRLWSGSDDSFLKKLFVEAEDRLPDLIRCLDDADQTVNRNAQMIIWYLDDPKGLAAIERWYTDRRKQGKNYWWTEVYPLPGEAQQHPILVGDDSNLVKLVLKNWIFSSEAVRTRSGATLLAYRKDKDRALIAVSIGCENLREGDSMCGEDWHVVVKKEGKTWRIIGIRYVWQS